MHHELYSVIAARDGKLVQSIDNDDDPANPYVLKDFDIRHFDQVSYLS